MNLHVNSVNRARRCFLRHSAAASAALLLPTWVVAFEESDVAKVARRNDATTGDSHKLSVAIKFANEAQESLKKIKDYEATFHKKEAIGRKLIATEMQIKFREQPFSVFIKYVAPHAGREVIYVAGQNKGKLLAHAEGIASLVGTLKLSPDSKDAMEENRYPITMFGMSKMVETVVAQWEAELKQNPDEAVVKLFPNAKLDKVECKVVESSYPKPVNYAKFQMTRLYLAKDTGLPVRVEQFGFPMSNGEKPIIEEYNYSNIRTNIDLTDHDFDTKNKAYGF